MFFESNSTKKMLVCSWMQIYKGIVSVKIQQKIQNLAVQKSL